MKTACVILAGGLGKRMRSSLPKVLHKVMGTAMIGHVVETARRLKPERVVVVAGKHLGKIRDTLGPEGISFALQAEAKGTGHALLCARESLKGFGGTVVVLNGDTPLITAETIRKLMRLHERNDDVISVLSFRAKDPSNYGRVVRNGPAKVSIVEEKDATADEKRIEEVNSGVYALDRKALALLDQIRKNPLKGEYYLTDIVATAADKGMKTSAYCIGEEEEFMGVNTPEELCRASALMKKDVVRKLVGKGVTLVDPRSVYIHPRVSIGSGTTIYQNVCIEGRSKIGRGATIYPNVRLRDAEVGSNAVIKDSTVVEGSRIGHDATVGPFAHVRPGSVIGAEAKIGNFVELKKTVIGKTSKASHLTYLGDAKIGKGVNIGAGTITCNYDGAKKHVTHIGDDVFVGSDSQFIAPVKVGKGAYIGAGSTITRNVPREALAVSRVAQKNISGWARKKKSKTAHKKEK